MTNLRERENLAFLQDGGEMGALMRAHDRSTSPLGEPEEAKAGVLDSSASGQVGAGLTKSESP